MAPYQYSPLNEDAKEVRILTLLSEESSPDLRMQIDTAPLTAENPPVFEALSYTWGIRDIVGQHKGRTIWGRLHSCHTEFVHRSAISSI
jgi:hypothetical protein